MGRGASWETQLWGLRQGKTEEHTENMLAMFVTLDVSRVSGWLNAILVFVVQLCSKPCRVKSGSYSARCGLWEAGRAWGRRVQKKC